jgi:hypothetical protein
MIAHSDIRQRNQAGPVLIAVRQVKQKVLNRLKTEALQFFERLCSDALEAGDGTLRVGWT